MRDCQMEEPTVMYQKEPAISGGPIAACLLRGETRKNILEENDNPDILSERATLQDSAE